MAGKDLLAADVMTKRVASISPDANIRLAAELMLKRRVSALPVVDAQRRIVGIVSEGDLVHRSEMGTSKKGSWWLNLLVPDRDLAHEYARAHGRRVSDVMTRRVVAATRTTPLAGIVDLMDKHRIKRVPIVDDGRLVGMVSRADLLAAFARGLAGNAKTPRGLDDAAALSEIETRIAREKWSGSILVATTVERGVARLSGVCSSIAQRDALRSLAEEIDGIRRADITQLRVDPKTVALKHSLAIPGIGPKKK